MLVGLDVVFCDLLLFLGGFSVDGVAPDVSNGDTSLLCSV